MTETTENKTLYKVIIGKNSCHGGTMRWTPGKWHYFKGSLKMCEAGFHLTTDPSKWFKAFCDIYVAETKDKTPIIDGDKVCVRSVKLIRKLTDEERENFHYGQESEIRKLPEGIQTKLKSFIQKDISEIQFFRPKGKPLKDWKVFYGENWGAARDAARDAARGAAWDAARGAARDAALISDYILIADLEFPDKEKHLAHARARWEVWKRGYGLVCDVDGILYVYAVRKGKYRSQP